MVELLALNKQYYLSLFYGINPGGLSPQFIPLLTGIIPTGGNPTDRDTRLLLSSWGHPCG